MCEVPGGVGAPPGADSISSRGAECRLLRERRLAEIGAILREMRERRGGSRTFMRIKRGPRADRTRAPVAFVSGNRRLLCHRPALSEDEVIGRAVEIRRLYCEHWSANSAPRSETRVEWLSCSPDEASEARYAAGASGPRGRLQGPASMAMRGRPRSARTH